MNAAIEKKNPKPMTNEQPAVAETPRVVVYSDGEPKRPKQRILWILKNEGPKSSRELSDALGDCGANYVNTYLNDLKSLGDVRVKDSSRTPFLWEFCGAG